MYTWTKTWFDDVVSFYGENEAENADFVKADGGVQLIARNYKTGGIYT